MKIETSKYVLTISESYSSFNKYTYRDTLEHIKNLKATPLVKGKLSKDTRLKIASHRRFIKSDWPRIYRVNVYFKRYRHRMNFDLEYYHPAPALNVKKEKTKHPKYSRSKGITFAKALKDGANDALGRYRREILQHNTDKKMLFKEYEVDIMGNRYGKSMVYSRPDQLRIICIKRKVKDLYVPKTPEKSCRYVGLELEFCAPIEELDFAFKLWKAGIHKYAQMKKDGSLRPKSGEHGFELALLFPESHYKRNLRQVCKILAEVGARADDRRCGLHVHIDMRRRKKDIVYNNLVACQNVLFSFLDPSRRDNEFCRTVESRAFPTKFENSREERYKTINAASYYKYKTLEIRMHEGSVSYNPIANWIALLIKISNHKIRVKSDINELTILKKRFRMDDKMKEFFQDKKCHWQLQGPQRQTRATSNPFRVGTLEEAAVRMDSEPPTMTGTTAIPF